jgi:ABC-2 type transport system permease protein
MGFRPNAGLVEWIAAIGLLLLLTLALTWLAVALGLVATRPEVASNLPLPLILLPFIGSGFVPTDSMPAGLRQFAEYQPFTSINETLRGLLMGAPIGHNGVVAAAWCVAIAAAGYLWAKKLFNRDPGR